MGSNNIGECFEMIARKVLKRLEGSNPLAKQNMKSSNIGKLNSPAEKK